MCQARTQDAAVHFHRLSTTDKHALYVTDEHIQSDLTTMEWMEDVANRSKGVRVFYSL